MLQQLAAGSALKLLSAALFASVGLLNLRRRPQDAPTKQALHQFALWWFGLAAFTAQGALSGLLVAFGVDDLALQVSLAAIGYAPLCLALWGLLSYLLYIYLGTHRYRSILLLYHAALGFFLLALLSYTQPTSVVADGWDIQIVYARPVTGGPLALLVLAILGPVMAGAIAYGALYGKVKERAARRRVLLVSLALLLWFGLSAAARSRPEQADWWPLAARVLALGATALLLAAFRSPERRIHVM